jgi:hypothetical protein
MTLRAARPGSRSERCGEKAVGLVPLGLVWTAPADHLARPAPGGSYTGHRGRNGIPRSPQTDPAAPLAFCRKHPSQLKSELTR